MSHLPGRAAAIGRALQLLRVETVAPRALELRLVVHRQALAAEG